MSTENELAALVAAAVRIERGNISEAETVLKEQYPFERIAREERKYTPKEMMIQFLKDGFIDRYSGAKLIHPGMLRVMSQLLSPEVFPYHPHWKMDACHPAYWEFYPTIDHKEPTAKGGVNKVDNWVTTSMIKNRSKNAFALEDLGWSLYEAGNLSDWDGLTTQFLSIVKKDSSLLTVAAIRKWYTATKEALNEIG